MSNQPFTGTMTDGMAQTPVTVLASALSTAARQAEPVEASKICSRAVRRWFRLCSEKKMPRNSVRWRPVWLHCQRG